MLRFDFGNECLLKVLNAVAHASMAPEVDIEFTVKDPEGLKADLFRSAAENARAKAKVLCEASGVALGQLLSSPTIGRMWHSPHAFVLFPTRCYFGDGCLSVGAI